MIKGFEYVVKGFENEEYSEWFVVGWLVRKIATEGSAVDFHELPDFWKKELILKLREVDDRGDGWLILGSHPEDMMPHVQVVKELIEFDKIP
jgi:hypothetical protein